MLLTVKETAARLGISVWRVRQAIRDGIIKPVRTSRNGTYLIPESELRRILEGA